MAIPMQAMMALMQNPQLLASSLAKTGAQPPAGGPGGMPQGLPPGGPMPGMGGGPPAAPAGMATMTPAAVPPMAPPNNDALKAVLASQALGGVQAPAMAPGGMGAPSAPGGGLPQTGFKPGANELMQLLMSSQQRPTAAPSLGSAILGR